MQERAGMTYLNVKGSVEAHLEVSLIILVKETQETLLEDGGGKRVGQDDGTVCRVGHRFHFQETDLVKATSEKVDCMAVVGSALGEAFVELFKALEDIQSE